MQLLVGAEKHECTCSSACLCNGVKNDVCVVSCVVLSASTAQRELHEMFTESLHVES